MPVPALVMCEQLGVPFSEHPFFLSNSVKLVSVTASETERDEAFGSPAGCLMNLIATKEDEPGSRCSSRGRIRPSAA